MDNYVLGKDVQEIKDALLRIERAIGQTTTSTEGQNRQRRQNFYDYVGISELLDKAEETLGVHPSPTGDEIFGIIGNGIKDNLLSMVRSRSRLRSIYDDLPTPEFLNPQEQALFQENGDLAYSVFFRAAAAESLATLNWVPPRHNDNGDAFRHCYWSYAMVRRVGLDWAKRWGDAHELGASGQPAVEREMDLWNNQVGRNAGESGEQSVSFIMELVRSGVCRRIVNGQLVPSNDSGEIG